MNAVTSWKLGEAATSGFEVSTLLPRGRLVVGDTQVDVAAEVLRDLLKGLSGCARRR